MAGSGPVNNQTPITTQTTLPSANAGGVGQAQEGTWMKKDRNGQDYDEPARPSDPPERP